MPLFARTDRVALFAVSMALVSPACASVTTLAWDTLPPLPPSAGQSQQVGVAGPFAGVHRDALLVAGGANFPEKRPWDGGAKI